MIARLHIETALREQRTFLKSCFHTTPFKIANITEDKKGGPLKLMLMTSSPGVLDGDKHDIKIELDEGSSLQLQTQSYQRLFNMKMGASQKMELFMKEGSSFCYLPHPSVPHNASDFVSINKIHLSNRCKLTWGEVLTCGRKLNGEAFQFTRFQNRTEIFLNERLIVKENLLMKPSTINVKAIGQMEGFTHQASLIYMDETAVVNDLVAQITGWLATLDGVCFGVSALPVNGVIVRLLGFKGEQLFHYLQNIARLLTAKEAV